MTDTVSSLLEDYATEQQFAQTIRKSVRTVQRMRQRRIGPAVTKIGRDLYYSKQAIERWLKSLEQTPVRAPKRRRAA